MSPDKTRIRRLPEREIRDSSAIHAILDEGLVCHVAYVTGGRPVVLPTLYARDGGRLILHGSKGSGLTGAVKAGSPLSVAVTLIDGLVVARSGFHSSANYRSVVVHGHGTILEGEERRLALNALVDHVIPGRLADIRGPTLAEIRQTAAIALPLTEISAKARTGGPKDDEFDLGTGVWAGVVPMRLESGDPIPSDDLEEGVPIPGYLAPHRRR